MITVQHSRGPHRGVTTEAIPDDLAVFIVMNGGIDVVECDLALRMWRFEAQHGHGMTIQNVRNSIKSRLPKDCDDLTAHSAQLLQNLHGMGMPVHTKTTPSRHKSRPKVEFSIIK